MQKPPLDPDVADTAPSDPQMNLYAGLALPTHATTHRHGSGYDS
jgi:hypothetical protein